MTKNDIINEVVSSLVFSLNKDQLELVKSTFIVKMHRKTFASMEYRRTKDVKYVSILLGHSSTAVTEKFYLVDDLKEIEYQALYAA